VAVDASGIVYVTDHGTIRRIALDGSVTTIAGTAGQAGNLDGVGAAARFNYPQGLAIDGFGNIYVADTLNNTIRKITPSGL
jgi:DNA-binding beta-propeller fold protein YncE